ncbi:putative glycosyltransferase [Sulfolobales Beppu rod-shaped virus 1]|uniref:Putative glycosyltransferase n=1 Tax=Sulfolobales Beppu rod-shaped virus 1 TaxID=2493121 RepID=A0A3S8NF86_9VIRU|nr:putative glycosyltransferase [Sulfolobales Beppu rod-shaped virus 1]AZI75937.1 putative glycosyltransferase [Sulfolobales Beppu rod-shaped virus 1]
MKKKKTIFYVYPQHHDVSFKYVAQQHIAMLREKYIVYEIPALSFYQFTPFNYPISIIHPFFYSMWRWGKIEFSFYDMYRSRVSKILGVEVADTDKIAEQFVNYANNLSDGLIVNSNWSHDVFINSGTKVPVYVVPHNFNGKLLLPDDKLKVNEKVLQIEKLKNEKKFKLVMISLWHSDYRKGADIFHEIARRVQKERQDVYFLVKSGGIRQDFNDLKMFNIAGVVSFDNMVKMYRISDLYLLTSRGGSFELNGLEAFVSGIPVIATKDGAWVEYFPSDLQDLLVDIAKKPRIFLDNPIHIGNGVEMNIEKAVDKVLEVLDNIEDLKEKVKKNKKFWIENYSFEAIKQKLLDTMQKIE